MLNKNDCVMIEKGIPLPKPRLSEITLPFRDMEVGDSILLPKRATSSTKCGGIAHAWGKKTGFKFATRNVQVDGLPRVRVWRIA
jgi:hypothetical protein